MGGVKFGTLSDREAAGEYLHNFFTVVDRGLRPVLGGKPLLLAGVHEEAAAYRQAARYEPILEREIPGGVDFLSPREIAERAAEASLAHYNALGERVYAECLEWKDRSRVLEGPQEALRAAAQGRVHRLCVRAHVPLTDPAEEGLINAAAVETLRTGGEVFVLPPASMPAARPAVALLRY
jgi:hypothetical protein